MPCFITLGRLILVAATFLSISCYKPHRPEDTTIYDTHFEILHGKVKQLTEISKVLNGTVGTQTDVTDFDERGNAIRTKKIGPACGACEVNFNYKYSNSGRKTEITMTGGESHIYTCDKNGRISKEDLSALAALSESDDKSAKIHANFYKYDANGNVIQRESYAETYYLSKYLYKGSSQLLVEEDVFPGGKLLLDKTTYTYDIFDKHGNWLQRIAVESNYFNVIDGKPDIRRDTLIRRITYY